MHFIKWFPAFILCIVLNKSLFAQDQPLKLTPAIKAEVIDSLASALKTNYVYEDTAIRMGSRIKPITRMILHWQLKPICMPFIGIYISRFFMIPPMKKLYAQIHT